MKPGLILVAGGVMLAGLAIYGGVRVNHSMHCDALEEDYVNGASGLRGTVAIKALGGKQLTDAGDELQHLTLQRMKLTLDQIYGECGSRAGATAARKASDELLGA